MKNFSWLFVITVLVADMFSSSALADQGGGHDGGHHGGGDYHHGGSHSHHHHGNLVLGIGGYYDPWFWGGYYGPGVWGGYYGPGFWGSYGYRGYGYADPYFRPHYTYPPAAVMPSQPPVYIQQRDPQPSQPKAGYWYYCRNPEGYYPYVRECPDGWLQVAPQPYVP